MEETPKHLARRDSGAPPRMESIQIYSLERFTERCVCLFCSPHGNDNIFRTQGAHLRFARLVKCLGHYIHRELFELPFSSSRNAVSFSSAIFASYTADRIRNALPVIPFASRNERSQRVEHLLFTELGHELLKLALHLTGNRCSKLGRNILFRTTPTV